ncbi:hypothetical protein ABZZ74_52555 [Streptomyces sp. NPDC006476]|uniref:hypothetical protein n=1 Tax=Streptomyces sp. NPDC006476 TaxID=3157175 RepID=UPI0033AD0736
MAVIAGLRRLHEAAEDPDIDRMPADDELFQALIYLEAHAGALKDEKTRRFAAIQRITLWEYLREQAEIHQAKAIADAREANAEWAQLAPALAVNAPSAAYNKAARLRAVALTALVGSAQPVRRTPEAVMEAERLVAAQAEADRRAAAQAAQRHSLLAPVAQRLLENRDGLDDGDEVTYWLDEIAEVLPNCHTPIQFVSLETYVKAVVRELGKVARRNAGSAGATLDAQLAYAAAADLVAGV